LLDDLRDQSRVLNVRRLPEDPLSLFSVKGKTAVITGATGAFGALAAKVWPAPAPMW
jgi:hypothetical protein